MSARPAPFHRSRVARRLFAVFVVCAFVPLAAIALLSFVEVRSLLVQHGDQRLTATAKSYAMTIYERLLLAGDVALAAAHPAGEIAPDSLPARTFVSLAMIDTASGVAAPILGDFGAAIPAEARERLAQRQPALLIDVRGKEARVLLFTPLPAPSRSFIAGQVRPDFLWGPADELPTATDFCVLEDVSGRLLHCSRPIDDAVLKRVAGNAPENLTHEWTRGDERFRARQWAQFMKPTFGANDWRVVAAQPERYQLAKLDEFRRIYIPVVALAFVLVVLLTVRQARHIVRPVAQLAENARRMAGADFKSGHVEVKGDDELGELASAFEQMSQRLGRQFASLTALSEIDRLILSTQDTAHIVHTTLRRLRELVQADLVAVTLFETENADHARTYFLPREVADNSMVRHEISAEDRQRLEEGRAQEWHSFAAGGSMPAYLAQVRAAGLDGAFVQPVIWRGVAYGAVTLAYRGATHPSDEDKLRAQELADRIAVAVSSAWRDQQLYAQAHYDTLTGVPNRLLFTDRLKIEIARSQREKLVFALLFVDLDHFKTVNDSFGHGAGDLVLCEAVRRITSCIRASDTVSRLGGDEFTVLLTKLNHPQEAWLIAESMVESLSREFVFEGTQCFLSASVGIATFPTDGDSAEDLLKSADTAMYRAKAAGRSQAVFFEGRMNAEAMTRVTLDRDLRRSMERGELALYYQPQLDLATGQVRSAEALLRWRHPTRGIVSPAEFIAIAEESGFIEQLGSWTLVEACRQLRQWRDQGLGIEQVSVNVSPRQFRRRALVDEVQRAARDAGVPAGALKIEITEGLLIERSAAAEVMLRQLAQNGHGISLDDFGTGFSSMSYLKRFPVHEIKIDRAFVDGLESSSDSEAIVSAIIAMSRALGKKVVAEGVETAEQLEILRALGCDCIQGYWLSPALPADQFAALVRARTSEAAVA